MDNQQLKQQLMATFKVQLEEHLSTLNKGLLDLEKSRPGDDQTAIVFELFRAAHSIKGAARAVELSDIEGISHRMEDVFGEIKNGQKSPTHDVIDALLGDVDTLTGAMDAHLFGDAHHGQTVSEIQSADTADMVLEDNEPEKNMDSEPSLPLPEQQADPAVSEGKSDKNPGKSPVVNSPKTMEKPGFAKAPAETIRVATSKIDGLMDGIGELLVARMRNEQRLKEISAVKAMLYDWEKDCRKFLAEIKTNRSGLANDKKTASLYDYLLQTESRLKDMNKQVQGISGRVEGDYRHLVLLTDEIQESVQRIRMVPVSSLFELFPRMVRDLGREQKKDVSLNMAGENTEIDRQILESMKDPLTHLIRNAVDHGIEMPRIREAAGKSRSGTVNLTAFQQGNSIVIEVFDDGGGIDLGAVQKTARKKGLLPDTSEDDDLSHQQAITYIFQSGFSTLGKATHISGRGIGMDVVKKNLEKLHGVIDVSTEQGNGTTFTLTLPLTLATSHVLLMDVSGQRVAVPTNSVERILIVDPSDVGSIEGKSAINLNGKTLPLISMAHVLELESYSASPESDLKKLQVIVLGSLEKKFAFIVDNFATTQEVVVKNIGKQLGRVRNISGATIIGTGQVVMVLNVSDLIKTARASSAGHVMKKAAEEAAVLKKVLVVDDSITTRTLEKNILENAGYQVFMAVDGVEGWELIQNEVFDAIVLDVEMPRMNGFELAEKLREDKRFDDLPVILVTSLESDKDRLRGMETGADAYITKGSFDQLELLETIDRLIG